MHFAKKIISFDSHIQGRSFISGIRIEFKIDSILVAIINAIQVWRHVRTVQFDHDITDPGLTLVLAMNLLRNHNQTASVWCHKLFSFFYFLFSIHPKPSIFTFINIIMIGRQQLAMVAHSSLFLIFACQHIQTAVKFHRGLNSISKIKTELRCFCNSTINVPGCV